MLQSVRDLFQIHQVQRTALHESGANNTLLNKACQPPMGINYDMPMGTKQGMQTGQSIFRHAPIHEYTIFLLFLQTLL